MRGQNQAADLHWPSDVPYLMVLCGTTKLGATGWGVAGPWSADGEQLHCAWLVLHILLLLLPLLLVFCFNFPSYWIIFIVKFTLCLILSPIPLEGMEQMAVWEWAWLPAELNRNRLKPWSVFQIYNLNTLVSSSRVKSGERSSFSILAWTYP